jgi:hypothetical protein
MNDDTALTLSSRTCPPGGIPPNLLMPFEYVSKLPMELRLKIWKLVPQKHQLAEERLMKNNRGNSTHRFVANMLPLLYVCRESRQEAKEWYKFKFNNSSSTNSVYFDNAIDIFYNSGLRHSKQKICFIELGNAGGDIKGLKRLILATFSLYHLFEEF